MCNTHHLSEHKWARKRTHEWQRTNLFLLDIIKHDQKCTAEHRWHMQAAGQSCLLPFHRKSLKYWQGDVHSTSCAASHLCHIIDQLAPQPPFAKGKLALAPCVPQTMRIQHHADQLNCSQCGPHKDICQYTLHTVIASNSSLQTAVIVHWHYNTLLELTHR
jgi:hypothetical protein